jgi:hypothetical protein
MKQDFENLNRNLQIGAIVVTILISIIICLGVNIYKLTKHNLSLYDSIELKDKEIVRINKVAYKRFVIASDLTDICNKFQSSRNAKKEYYLNN